MAGRGFAGDSTRGGTRGGPGPSAAALRPGPAALRPAGADGTLHVCPVFGLAVASEAGDAASRSFRRRAAGLSAVNTEERLVAATIF